MSSQELVPAGSHTLVINEPDTTRAIMLMDSHDLEQAMAELRGEVLATFVYRPKGAKPQLTYAGVKEAARLYRNVHFGATAVPLGDGTWMITSYAHNLADNTRVDYPMPYPAFDLANQEQAIKFRANLSKSLRNALAAVLPVAYLQTMIERWLEQGNEGRPAARSVPHAAERPGGRAPLVEVVSSDPHAALRGQVAGALKLDPEAASKLPKGTAEMSGAELEKTHAWLANRALRQASVTREQPAEPAPAPNAEEDWPRSAAEWSRAQLRSSIQEMAGHELKTGKDLLDLARTHGQPQVSSTAEMTQAWLLGLYQAMRAAEYAEAIAGASTEQAVTDLVSEALGERDRRQISAPQYGDLSQAGEARKAELSAPLLAGGQGRAQAAS